MNVNLPLANDEATAFMSMWFQLLTAALGDLRELGSPQDMPVEMIGVHHLVQAGYATYEALIRVSGFTQHPDHVANTTLYAEYIAALPL